MADKGYDADHLVNTIVETGAEVVIPLKRDRKVQRSYDERLYRERDAIERFFCKLNSSGASPRGTTSCSQTSWDP